ncbi:citrulline utilization hydrolase CtlX [Robiginitalea sp. SC105]|uniref:citrulline utilization hydrolase CtlX n=1 Tax=Robiginitalea sp. SC105 TaxID=2762332 RepID=UPI00163B4899|nr:arginine deiminase-related protein [Robiginitalea sp. SC105]MBC2839655.1 amidinotransferase [Robiginitalea sp. SC105]
MQITDSILMIRPVQFRMNEQTAVNNFFQEDLSLSNAEINRRAQEEFDTFVDVLRDAGIHVTVVEDRLETDTPDSIFPNNWISFHASGLVVIYPMYAVNRRRERREDIFDRLESEGFVIREVVDYTSAEADGIFLEGTGSVVLDRVNQKAYCALSDRADEGLLIEFCEDFELLPVIFTANQSVDGERKPIYHTNVMMCIAEDFAVICLESIDDRKERKLVADQLHADGRELIEITEAQVHAFAGNMIQLCNRQGERLLVMSKSAHDSLTAAQVAAIEKSSRIVSSPLETIETCGGGSARCMIAEVFLPKA